MCSQIVRTLTCWYTLGHARSRRSRPREWRSVWWGCLVPTPRSSTRSGWLTGMSPNTPFNALACCKKLRPATSACCWGSREFWHARLRRRQALTLSCCCSRIHRQVLKQHFAPNTAEGLLCNDKGCLLEGMITNFFIVTGKRFADGAERRKWHRVDIVETPAKIKQH